MRTGERRNEREREAERKRGLPPPRTTRPFSHLPVLTVAHNWSVSAGSLAPLLVFPRSECPGVQIPPPFYTFSELHSTRDTPAVPPGRPLQERTQPHMEIPSLQGFERERGLMTMEKPLKEDDEGQSLRIGVPREVANEERRVALAPSGVGALVANGHEVYVEQGAGRQAHFQDDEYDESGAELVEEPDDLYSQSDL